MKSTIHPSVEIIQLLEKLFSEWELWDQNKEYYINNLLPDLMRNTTQATNREKKIMREIKEVATPEEWQRLTEIADQFSEYQKKCLKISADLDFLIERYDFPAVEKYLADNPNSIVKEIYEQKLHAAINRIMSLVRSYVMHYDFRTAERLISPINQYLSDAEKRKYYDLVNAQQQLLIREITQKIEEACQRYAFDEIDSLYEKISEWVPREAFSAVILDAQKRQATEERQLYVGSLIDEIQSLLRQYRFEKADEKYRLIKDEYSLQDYQQEVHKYRHRQKREKVIASIIDLLTGECFVDADNIYSNSDILSEEEYFRIKAPFVLKYIQKQYGYPINLEKAIALAHPGRNLLVSARAGSGKTTVLACKTSLLIDTANVHPDQILVVAFNKAAALEIGSRIRKKFKQTGFVNARTFHSLAGQLVQPQIDILYDEDDNVPDKELSKFVQQLVKKKIKNPAFVEKMYAFFRKEMREIERSGFLMDDTTYFDFRRNLLQVTLNGEKVKSIGEKFIADLLFEHNINYKYEKVWLWGTQIYRPDFSIYENQQDYVIEHWGIDEYDTSKQVPPEWTMTWDEYYAEMESKRKFWKEKSVVLIETSIRDLRDGREAFEKILEKRLAVAGIVKKRMSNSELLQKVKNHDYTITQMTKLFVQFIQKAKKQMLEPKDVQQLLAKYQPNDERENVFIDLACRVYIEYETALHDENGRKTKMDYDDLIMQAIERIHNTAGESEIWLGKPKSRPVKMNELRWILIDEYQDFSRLFYELIAAIRKYNPQVQLFCVGDDWQAINGFAGSDLHYFHSFTNWVKPSSVAYLTTNFRSQAEIVRHGNSLMLGKGKPAESLRDNLGGNVVIQWMDDTWLELRNIESKAAQKSTDERFLFVSKNANGSGKRYENLVAAKYLKRCYEIILENLGEDEKVAILSRTGRIDGVLLREFKAKLISCFTESDLEKIPDPKHQIEVQTVHKYKGLEADLVIILNVVNSQFPLLHPNNALFEIFGKTMVDAFAEEQRLFYVALTRGKRSVFILTEKRRESVFLDKLPVFTSLKKTV